MSNRHWPVTLLILAFLMLVQLMGCSGTDTDDPRKTVIALFGAMEKNDQARIAYLIDLPELMKTSDHDYALAGGEARVFTDPQQILDDLTGDGQTKTRWFSLQRIVNKAQIIDETAFVEVTFVDKESSRGYRTKFGLTRMQGRWKIFSFQTEQQAP